MAKLKELLEENTDLIHVEQYGFMHCTYDLTELADMLKPLLAEVWAEGHDEALHGTHNEDNPYAKETN